MKNLDCIENDFKNLSAYIKYLKKDLIKILCNIESYATAKDEIERTLDCLENIGDESVYFDKSVNSIATFLPVNLPLYSLVLFAVIPSVLAKGSVYVRPPDKLMGTIKCLFKLLCLNQFFPQIRQCNYTRGNFLRRCVSASEVIIFTGTYKNAMAVKEHTPKNSLFIFNGQGINPVVVAEDADVNLAAIKTSKMKTFNSGQDCAAPDMVLCHEAAIEQFIEALCDSFQALKIGSYDDPETQIGPLIDPCAVIEAGKTIIAQSSRVIMGGSIDFSRSIVHPAIINCAQNSYKEVFSPIVMLRPFTNDTELECYFEHPTYRYHAMYASLFGTCEYLLCQQHTQVLKDKIVLDVEKGNKPYGGYARGASFSAYNKLVNVRPILISREISEFKKSVGV